MTEEDHIIRPWIREPGEYHYGNTVGLGGEWWTEEQAAREFNVTRREIRERYRPLMPSGTILDEVKSWKYTYDFEHPDFKWRNYNPGNGWSWDKYNRSLERYNRASTIFWSPEKEIFMNTDGDDLTPMTSVRGEDYEEGYDPGLEPRRAMITLEVELYHVGILMEIRRKKVESRKVKPLPARGGGGRFAKAG